jgi:hypothetical protein
MLAPQHERIRSSSADFRSTGSSSSLRRPDNEVRSEESALVLHPYKPPPEDIDDLELVKGETIRIISRITATSSPGWWLGSNLRGKSGLFPSNYVELIPQPPKQSEWTPQIY